MEIYDADRAAAAKWPPSTRGFFFVRRQRDVVCFILGPRTLAPTWSCRAGPSLIRFMLSDGRSSMRNF